MYKRQGHNQEPGQSGNAEPTPETKPHSPAMGFSASAEQPIADTFIPDTKQEEKNESSAGGQRPGGDSAPESEEDYTIFEIVKKVVRENPLLSVLILGIIAALIVLAGVRRYHKIQKEM